MFPPAWLWQFTQRSYLSEVILLERTPFLQKTFDNPSTGRRCHTLHAGWGGDLFGTLGRHRRRRRPADRLLLGLDVGRRADCSPTSGNPRNTWFTHEFQFALWLVVGLLTVVRFLGYLDLRIRREGWEVELLMRAEGARLGRAIDSGAGG